MDHATLVSIDLGKHCFHVHGQDSNGKAVFSGGSSGADN